MGNKPISPRNLNNYTLRHRPNARRWRRWCFPDIGSGLNAGRRQLQHLLQLVCEDRVTEIASTYEERLTHFGQAYLETLFSCFDVRLTIPDSGWEKTPEQEPTADLLVLIASFSGRLYGMRSHKQKELVKCARAVMTSL